MYRVFRIVIALLSLSLKFSCDESEDHQIFYDSLDESLANDDGLLSHIEFSVFKLLDFNLYISPKDLKQYEKGL